MTGLLTAPQVAEILQVPTSWVRAETRAERMPYVKLGQRYRRYEEAQVRAWWEARRRGPQPEDGGAA